MAPPKKPDKPAQPPLDESDEELTALSGPDEDDDLSDIDLDDLDDLADLELEDDEPTQTSRHEVRDGFEDSRMNTDIRNKIQAQKAAPEVSQGPWRDRVFLPRGAMPPDQLLKQLEDALKVASMQPASTPVDKQRIALLHTFAPLLRQAVELAGGDGIDAWVSQVLHPPGRKASDLLVTDLSASIARVNRAKDGSALLAAAADVQATVARHLSSPDRPKVSLKALEQELEGRLDVDVILQIVFSTDDELQARLRRTDGSLDQLRQQLRAMPGAQPDGLMWNFGRLKVEKRVLEAELNRRKTTRGS